MQPSAGDKPDRMQSQEKHNPIYYAQVNTDYESTWKEDRYSCRFQLSAYLIKQPSESKYSKIKS